ncbi:MAG: hypothetical protein ACTSUQ_10475 [Candidatus Freyarchaeota archaeon]
MKACRAEAVVGSLTAVVGMMWLFLSDAYMSEIQIYLLHAGFYLSTVLAGIQNIYMVPYPVPFLPSAHPFRVFSFTLAALLVATGFLVGASFYNTYKTEGRAAGVVGYLSCVVGFSLGALLITFGNLTSGYMETIALVTLSGPMGPINAFFSFSLQVPTNFRVIGMSFIILGLVFLLLGSVSLALRESSTNYPASVAAGILSIVAAPVFVLSGLVSAIIGTWVHYLAPVWGFALVFVTFMLWAFAFGGWRLEFLEMLEVEKASLIGAVGGVAGVIMALAGLVWGFIFYWFQDELSYYLPQVGFNFAALAQPSIYGFVPFPYPLSIFPSWNLFVMFSCVLGILIAATGVLTVVGLHGFQTGEALVGVCLVFCVLEFVSGASLLTLGSLTTGYSQTPVPTGELWAWFSLVPQSTFKPSQ